MLVMMAETMKYKSMIATRPVGHQPQMIVRSSARLLQIFGESASICVIYVLLQNVDVVLRETRRKIVCLPKLSKSFECDHFAWAPLDYAANGNTCLAMGIVLERR